MSMTVAEQKRAYNKRAFGDSAHNFSPEEASHAAKKRWDAIAAEDNDVRKRFRTELTLEEGMEELARLRKVCELAASELNQRMNAAGEKCDICGREFDGRTRPVQISAKRDPATGVLYNKFYCSIICLQQKNKRELGLEALIK